MSLLLTNVDLIDCKESKIKRINFINDYIFPRYLINRFVKENSEINHHESKVVIRALKDYFIMGVCAYPNGSIAMPSHIVDQLWHTFLIFTPDYTSFCQKAFGYYFHHIPDEVDGVANDKNVKIRTWELACELDKISPWNAPALPLIFDVDRICNIKKGKRYNLVKTISQYRNIKNNDNVSKSSVLIAEQSIFSLLLLRLKALFKYNF